MLKLEKNLQKKFDHAAKAIRRRLDKRPGRDVLRGMIQTLHVGKFRKCTKLGGSELSKIVDNGGLAGVDGSTNTAGGAFPYVVTKQRALAKTCSKHPEISEVEVFSPLLFDDLISEDEYREYVKKNLADIEVRAAKKVLERYKPQVILMDGSLVRYKIEAASEWEELCRTAAMEGTAVVGVVEGISTRAISSAMKNKLPVDLLNASDWEMLFGILDVGEVLEMSPGLFKDGFFTCFMRSSYDPLPIGLDLLEEQKGYMCMAQDLIFTLTPKNGRGIPVWLDIIDSKVRITDDLIDRMLRTYLGQDYFEFMVPKRERRSKLW
jgi:hypothetical protein